MFVELLKRIEIFSRLSDEQLARIVMSCEKIIFHPEQSIIRKGEIGDKGFLILEGYAHRINGPGIDETTKIRKPEILEVGTFIGEMALLMQADYGSTIVACSEVKALQFSHTALFTLMENDVSIAQHFADCVQQRFMQFTAQLKDLNETLVSELDEAIIKNDEDDVSHITLVEQSSQQVTALPALPGQSLQ